MHLGHEGVRELANVLESYVSAADYNYDQVVVEGDYAFLRWSAQGADVVVHDGVDSFVVRNRIIVQTIHYSRSARHREGSAADEIGRAHV